MPLVSGAFNVIQFYFVEELSLYIIITRLFGIICFSKNMLQMNAIDMAI